MCLCVRIFPYYMQTSLAKSALNSNLGGGDTRRTGLTLLVLVLGAAMFAGEAAMKPVAVF